MVAAPSTATNAATAPMMDRMQAPAATIAHAPFEVNGAAYGFVPHPGLAAHQSDTPMRKKQPPIAEQARESLEALGAHGGE